MTAAAQPLPGMRGPRPPSQLEPDTRAWLKANPQVKAQHAAAARGLLIAAQEYDSLRHDPDGATRRVYVLAEYRKWLDAVGGTPATARQEGAAHGGRIAALRSAGPARLPDPQGVQLPPSG